jgi:N-acetylmuramic acid 6-phosphate etherase
MVADKPNRKGDVVPGVLGVEGGGTRTSACWLPLDGSAAITREFGPANLKLIKDAQLVRLFRSLARAFPAPQAVVVGLAGARTQADWQRIERTAGRVWPKVPVRGTNDLVTALASAQAQHPEISRRILVLSGTGSCCYGQDKTGRTCQVGGWGHWLGDQGSAYAVGLRALRTVVAVRDSSGHWPTLGQALLRQLQLNEPNQFIPWIQTAEKAQVAALAMVVEKRAAKRDPLAQSILAEEAERLASDAAACALRLGPSGQPAVFVLAGGMMVKGSRFRQLFLARLLRNWPTACPVTPDQSGSYGAACLAQELLSSATPQHQGEVTLEAPAIRTLDFSSSSLSSLPPTEQRNPRSNRLDRMSLNEAIALMLTEEDHVVAALREQATVIEKTIQRVVRAFRQGGRLFYVGAGTSGRLGILDASECPPTFRTPPEWVQGIIAGGQRAIWEAVEGAEDDVTAGAQAIIHRGVTARDVVVGIAASGRTPFVWGALKQADKVGATTVLLCFNPQPPQPKGWRPDLVIAANTGPEILTGSTRLKAGTATKLVLNMITTLSMVRLGKVAGNLMVDLNPSNTKLRDRAVRIVTELTGCAPAPARQALEQQEWRLQRTLVKLGWK